MRIAVAGGTGRVGRHLVDALTKSGHEVVPMSRTTGVDVVTGEGLAEALKGVECIIDAATGPSPGKEEATAFFTAAVTNIQRAGEQAGVRQAVLVSIIGVDKLTTSYGAAKREQEKAWLAGPIPVRILRSDLFHEFVGPMMEWGRQGDVIYLPRMRRQPVAARSVAEALADLATTDDSRSIVDIAGPRVENLVDLAAMLAARDGDPVKVEGVSDPDDPDSVLYESGQVLAGPDAIIAGPTFAEWLETDAARHQAGAGRVTETDDGRKPVRDLQAIADRVEIEALRGEFTDAGMMRDYDRFASLFTADAVWRIPAVDVEFGGREEIRAGVERLLEGLWDYLVQTTHSGTIQLAGDTASGRAYVLSFGHMREGSSHLNYSVYHDRYQRTPDGWKFTERIDEIKYLDTTPLTGSPPAATR